MNSLGEGSMIFDERRRSRFERVLSWCCIGLFVLVTGVAGLLLRELVIRWTSIS